MLKRREGATAAAAATGGRKKGAVATWPLRTYMYAIYRHVRRTAGDRALAAAAPALISQEPVSSNKTNKVTVVVLHVGIWRR